MTTTTRSRRSSNTSRRHPSHRAAKGMPTQGMGSGFIISTDGYIVTNHHVVDDADKIMVKLNDKREFPAKVIGSDPRSDIALLKIDASGLPTVTIGGTDNLKVGQWVFAIGAPFGLERTATKGIVRCLGPLAAERHLCAIHPNRRADQPRQFRRPAVRSERQGGGHQLADLQS